MDTVSEGQGYALLLAAALGDSATFPLGMELDERRNLQQTIGALRLPLGRRGTSAQHGRRQPMPMCRSHGALDLGATDLPLCPAWRAEAASRSRVGQSPAPEIGYDDQGAADSRRWSVGRSFQVSRRRSNRATGHHPRFADLATLNRRSPP